MAVDDRELVARVEGVLGQLESLQDPTAREWAMEALQAVLELYGEGLNRVMGVASRAGGEPVVDALVGDELVSHLLILHDLHPVDVETRVVQALDEVRPYLGSHGGGVELLGIEDGVARLRLEGTCNGCPSSTTTMKLAIEEAIQKAAPELEGVDAEGVAEPAPSPLLKLEVSDSLRQEAAPDGDGAWAVAGGLPELSGGGTLLKEVAGEPVLFVRLDGELYAYRHRCPSCQGSLEHGALGNGDLACPECGHRYDVRRAGRCLDAPQLYLEPVPLLTSAVGIVKVAVGSAVG